MKTASIILGLVFLLSSFSKSQELKTFYAKAGSEMDYESLMVALNGGCNLGCAIGWTLTTTSTLNPQGTNSYEAKNMDDGNKNTAWIEGNAGYGIGEKIIITFTESSGANNIPFDGLELTNGYAKSQKAWTDNSRIKLLKLYHNKKPMFLIKLVDSIYPQSINWGRDFLVSSGDIVELEIIEVYEGAKWKDTGISDLSLNGAH
jgi:hypothetical protein